MENNNVVRKARSRRWDIVKGMFYLLLVDSVYIFGMIYFKPDILKDFIAYFLTTNGALIAAIGTWIGMTTYKKKVE